MLFGMVERGMNGEVLGDKGKPRGFKNVVTSSVASTLDGRKTGDEAMWAVNLTRELWKRSVWYVWLFQFDPLVFLTPFEGMRRKRCQ